MRPFIAAVLLFMPVSGGSFAQTAPSGVLTPAPVPNRGPMEVAPADRAGPPANGAERAAPFSGLPDTLDPSRGQATPSTLGDSTRQGAPAPSLSK